MSMRAAGNQRKRVEMDTAISKTSHEDAWNTVREVQLRCIGLQRVFDRFCRENGLLYYVCGGGCIGAVRHQGFIPWDDDIDVMMPRPDFEKLKKLWPEQMKDGRYVFCDNTETMYLRTMWASVCDEETTFIKERQKDLDISQGIKLEIIPLDGCPGNRLARRMQMFWALIRQIYINQEPPVSKGFAAETIGKLLLKLHRDWKSRYRAAMRCEKRMSRYPFAAAEKVTELTTRFRYMRNEYPKEAFQSAVYLPFEDGEIPVPAGYDTYLKMAFGDYMQLPPEEERQPKHETVFIDTNNSYRKYKGIYYCTEDHKEKQ